MKKIFIGASGIISFLVFCAVLFAQDTTPKGPSQWTARNWIGLCIQIGLFILAVIGIYKLSGIEDIPEAKEKGNTR